MSSTKPKPLSSPPKILAVGAQNKRGWDPALSPQLSLNTRKMKTLVIFLALSSLINAQQLPKVTLDFSSATEDPETGALCMMQEVCIGNLEALSSRLPQQECLNDGCNCASDADCGGGDAK